MHSICYYCLDRAFRLSPSTHLRCSFLGYTLDATSWGCSIRGMGMWTHSRADGCGPKLACGPDCKIDRRCGYWMGASKSDQCPSTLQSCVILIIRFQSAAVACTVYLPFRLLELKVRGRRVRRGYHPDKLKQDVILSEYSSHGMNGEALYSETVSALILRCQIESV